MSRLSFVVLFLVLSCRTVAPERPSMPGADGIDGRNGKDGVNGRSCASTVIQGKVAIQCEGQAAISLPVGEKGDTGAAGSNGRSCEILEPNGSSFIMRCPDQTSDSGFREIKVENGRNGENGKSCEVVSRLGGRHQIRCGDDSFILDQGEKGDRGESGRDGLSYATVLTNARILEKPNSASSNLTCVADFTTTDKDFAKRAMRVYLLQKDRTFLTLGGPAGDFAASRGGKLETKFAFNRSHGLSADQIYFCLYEIYAEFDSDTAKPIALSSFAQSPFVEVQKTKELLQKADELIPPSGKLTFSKSESGRYTASLTLSSSLDFPAVESSCKVRYFDGSENQELALTRDGRTFTGEIKLNSWIGGEAGQRPLDIGLHCNGDIANYTRNVKIEVLKAPI